MKLMRGILKIDIEAEKIYRYEIERKVKIFFAFFILAKSTNINDHRELNIKNFIKKLIKK